jgi:UPF0755 protein
MRKELNRQKTKNSFLNLVLVGLLIIAGLMTWILIPRLAADEFGVVNPALTSVQKWTYSAKLLTERNDLLLGNCFLPSQSKFRVEMGESVTSLSQKLEQNGIIRNGNSFRNYLIYKGLDTQILASDYSLDCSKTAIEIASQLQNNYQESVLFVILPGWRAEEIAAALATSGLEVSSDEFLKIIDNPVGMNLPEYLSGGRTLEGFLYPGEYTIDRNVTAVELAQIFVDRFVDEMNKNSVNLNPQNGLDFYQTIILSSIIQRESYNESERPLIASVFYNRLASGMKLETDPTVQYALGFNQSWGWWKSPLTSDDLLVNSPYNTYQINGLPPSPISNPDLSSILAAENPETSNYFFFRSSCDGSGTHVFASTLDEQIANACK